MNASDFAFGKPYYGCSNAQALIGVVPEEGGGHAVFRYYADLIHIDVRNVDACVLKICSRLSEDFDSIEDLVRSTTKPIKFPQQVPIKEELRHLKMSSDVMAEQTIVVFGFGQRESISVARNVDFASGLIKQHFHARTPKLDSSQAPRFEYGLDLILWCRTISGQSGGPCVDRDHKVLGILSCSDAGDPQQCYFVPSNEILKLVRQAKKFLYA